MNCPKCKGEKIAIQRESTGVRGAHKTVAICKECGNTWVVANDLAAYSKSKNVALWLCVFFGFLGVHQFYVGKKGKGILYLCTAGMVGIGWISDIFLIAAGKFRDSRGLPLQ